MGALRSIASLLAMVACVGGALAQENSSDWSSPEGVANAFLQFATRSAYSRRDHQVQKWVEGVRYRVVLRGGEEALYEKLVDVHMGHLVQLTGLDIQRASRIADANFVVVMTNDAHLVEDSLAFSGQGAYGHGDLFFRHSMCRASLRADATGAIRHAVAMIPVDRAHSAGQLVGCVAEELTHMMGLTNDTETSLPSIFSHGTVRSFLSGLDTVMLRMLYDSRVKPGMRIDTLRPLLHTIAMEYQQTGLLDLAERLAGASGLAELCP